MDLVVLNEFINRVHSIPQAEFELDDAGYGTLLNTVTMWRAEIRQLRETNSPTMTIGRTRQIPGDDI